jgi:glyoxylase-like metal-dependent hydrolase (beta-lactamase superfamily II)
MAGNFTIKPLKLEMNAGGKPFVVHATLLWDEQDIILFDTGLPGQVELIHLALALESVPFEKLSKIIITHQDMDHIGSLPELIAVTGGSVEVIAHELAKPFLTGEVPLTKRGTYATPSKVDATVQDGDILPYCGGIQVIFTPGHTPDHTSYYHIPSKTLISGDALISLDGKLLPPNPAFTPDYSTALQSVGKLLDYEIQSVITYHGGECTEQIKQRLADISAGRE